MSDIDVNWHGKIRKRILAESLGLRNGQASTWERIVQGCLATGASAKFHSYAGYLSVFGVWIEATLTNGAGAHVPAVLTVHEPLLCLISGACQTAKKPELVTAYNHCFTWAQWAVSGDFHDKNLFVLRNLAFLYEGLHSSRLQGNQSNRNNS